MKIKVQAQHLQPGDIVGSGEKVEGTILNSVYWHNSKVCVNLTKGSDHRSVLWGRYTQVTVERAE